MIMITCFTSGTKPKINILDILKPAEEVIIPPNLPDPAVATTQTIQPQATKVVIPLPEESENVTRWIVDQNFRREQERLKIPHGKFFYLLVYL